jgi:hypothetical protein
MKSVQSLSFRILSEYDSPLDTMESSMRIGAGTPKEFGITCKQSR